MAPRNIPIAVVSRETGISKDLLRKWEIRYGFPLPVRSEGGSRSYPLEQVKILQGIKHLVESGIRPREAIRLSFEHYEDAIANPPLPHAHGEIIGDCLKALRSNDASGVHGLLERSLVCLGLESFLFQTVAPLAVTVSEERLRERLCMYEERMLWETLSSFLAELHRRLRPAAGSPRVLLTTPSGESHSLGLDIVGLLFAEAGASCIPLGNQTSLVEINHAVRANDVDILALSFSAAYPPRLLLSVLTELRSVIPPKVSLWIGGKGALSASRLTDGVRAFVTASDAVQALRLKSDPG